MNLKQSTAMGAILAVMMSAGVAFGEESSTFDASVSVLSPDETGFIIGGQVSVNGLGSGALNLYRPLAEVAVFGGAGSELEYHGADDLAGVNSWADVNSSIAFVRGVSTSGSLVGQGSVVSRGEAIAAIGSAGAASATTETGGTDVNDDAGSATAEASAQGSLNGSLSTSNTLQLLGTSGLFAGSNALAVGEANAAVAYGSANIYGQNGATGIDLSDASVTGGNIPVGQGNGALFEIYSELLDGNEIDISVSNAGNGTISVTTSTGGFFTGGGAAAGSSTLSDTGSFFDEDVVVP